MPVLSNIYRFPVKGFNGIEMARASLSPGEGLPLDRRFAITNGLSPDYDGKWASSRNFVVNSIIDGIQRFRLQYDGDEITIVGTDETRVSFLPDNPSSVEGASILIAGMLKCLNLPDDLPPSRLVEHNQMIGNTNALWDYTDTPISLINLETVQAISTTIGETLDPRRFRGNLLIDGLNAWEELALVGSRIAIGEAELEIIRPINRCPATSINPATSERKPDVPMHMQEQYGHVFCGVYARVVKGGEIEPCTMLEVVGPAEMSWRDACPEAAPAYPLWPRYVTVTERQESEDTTILLLAPDSVWQLPEAFEGQRIRFHLGDKGWTGARLKSAKAGIWSIAVEDSKTGDPLTGLLRRTINVGERLLVSGPYGRP